MSFASSLSKPSTVIFGKQVNLETISQCVLRNDHVTFALYERKDVAGQTGISLLFDGVPKFTIDYGEAGAIVAEPESDDAGDDTRNSPSGSLPRSASESAPISSESLVGARSAVAANPWNSYTMTCLCELITVELSQKETMKKVDRLIDDLLKLKLGNYHALSNNCRHYCLKAAEVIGAAFAVGEKDLSAFRQLIESIRSAECS